MKNIAIFGGSFNPPHVGHQSIILWLISCCRFDEIRVVPCFKHPFGKELVEFDDRFYMCELMVDLFNNKFYYQDTYIVVDPIEKVLGGISSTLRLVKHYKSESPNDKFTLVLGNDLFVIAEQSNSWPEFEEIKTLVDINVINREGSPVIPSSKFSVSNVSSTDIKNKLQKKENVSDLVPRPVLKYIEKYKIYK